MLTVGILNVRLWALGWVEWTKLERLLRNSSKVFGLSNKKEGVGTVW